METRVFFQCGPCRGVILKTFGTTQLVVSCRLRVEFYTKGCEDRTRAREAEESPLLEAVAGERLMTQQAGKRLSGCCCNL
jgi:hypothetical protein